MGTESVGGDGSYLGRRGSSGEGSGSVGNRLGEGSGSKGEAGSNNGE